MKFFYSDKKVYHTVKVFDASNYTFIHNKTLVDNSTWANVYNQNRVKIIKTLSNVFDLNKLEDTICSLLRKSV